MHGVSFDLQPGWLRTHELERAHQANYRPGNFGGQPVMELAGRRSFAVKVGGERFVVSVDFVPVDGPTAFAGPAEPDRKATDGEILTLLARMFLGSLPEYPPAEPDVEAGYEEYRRMMAETAGYLPKAWENLQPEAREALAGMVRAASRGAEPAVSSDRKEEDLTAEAQRPQRGGAGAGREFFVLRDEITDSAGGELPYHWCYASKEIADARVLGGHMACIHVRGVLPEAVGSKDAVPCPPPTRAEETGTASAASDVRYFKFTDKDYLYTVPPIGAIQWHWEGKTGVCAFPIKELIDHPGIIETDADGKPLEGGGR